MELLVIPKLISNDSLRLIWFKTVKQESPAKGFESVAENLSRLKSHLKEIVKTMGEGQPSRQESQMFSRYVWGKPT